MKLALVKLELAGHQCQLDERGALEVQDTCWEGWKRRWFTVILISERTRLATNLFRSSFARHLEKERHYLSDCYYIIHPLSEFRLCWQIFMIFVLGGALALIPFLHAMFMPGHGEVEDKRGYLANLQFLLVLDGLSCIDIAMNFFTGYYVEETKEVVLEQSSIARRYLKGFFLIDVLSSFPLDYIVTTTYSSGKDSWNSFHSHFNALVVALKFLKIFRAPTLLHYVHQVTTAFGVHFFTYRLIHIVLVLGIFINWTACFQFLLPMAIHGESLMDDSLPTYNCSWVNHYKIRNETVVRKLRVSVGRMLAQMTSTGPCVITRDYFLEDLLLRPLVSFTGKICNAYVLAAIILMFMTRHETEFRYCSMMDQLEKYMYHRKAPPRLKRRLRRYFEYRYDKRHFKSHTVITSMPALMRSRLDMAAVRHLIANVAIFQKQNYNAISTIVEKLKQEIFLKDDVIVKFNTPGDCMYFIESGAVKVVGPYYVDEDRCAYKEYGHLVDGDHFGEMCLVEEHQIRTATVIAEETTTCYRLDRVDFTRCYELNHSIFRQVMKESEKRLKVTNSMMMRNEENPV